MKHSSQSPELDPATVVDAARSAGVEVSCGQAELLIVHAQSVLEANRHMNLTRITTAEEVVALHIVDSLAFLPHVAPIAGRVFDIGSGAGYPGVPLAIMGADVTLCESVKKKASFLGDVVAQLRLNVEVKPLRAEELAAAEPGSADVVIARAVSATASLLELASPLLRFGGRLIALKGSPQQDELDRAARAAPICGMRRLAIEYYRLPTGQDRAVLVYEKSGTPRIALPRRQGAAQRQPLG